MKNLFNILFTGGAIGAINGLIWALVVNATFSRGVIIGVIVGAIACFLITFYGLIVASKSEGRILPAESAFVSGSLTATLGTISAVLGIIVWIVRIAIQ